METAHLITKEEIWKDIEGFEGYYQVSNKGNVRSLDRIVNYKNGRVAKYKGKEVAINSRSNGYLKVNLYIHHTMKNLSVHRLVANSFIKNTERYPAINHKDENKTNNIVENLEWCTNKYNSNYGTAISRTTYKNSTPVLGKHLETGEKIKLKSMTEGTKHGFTQQGISDVCTGKYGTHRGYFFEKTKSGEII